MQRIPACSQQSQIQSDAFIVDNASDILSLAETPKFQYLPMQSNIQANNSDVFSGQVKNMFGQMIQQINNYNMSSEEKALSQKKDQSILVDPLKYLFSLKDSIGSKMVELCTLNEVFYEKQQKMFLKTFVNMMDRMSNELMQTKQKLKNIDQEIQELPDCVRMRQKMEFYRDQCVLLRHKMRKQQKQTEQIRMRCQKKDKKLAQLQKKLYEKKCRSSSYKKRKYSLQTKINEEIQSKNIRSFITQQQMGTALTKSPIPKLLKSQNQMTIEISRPKTQTPDHRNPYFLSHNQRTQEKSFRYSSRQKSHENSLKKTNLVAKNQFIRSQFVLKKGVRNIAGTMTNQTYNQNTLQNGGVVMSARNFNNRGYLIKQRFHRKQY